MVVARSLLDLLDVDAPGLRSSRLRNDDAEDTILHAGLDGIMVDARREGESAAEGTAVELPHPVPALWRCCLRCLLSDLAGLGGFSEFLGLLRRVLVFDCGLVGIGGSLATVCDLVLLSLPSSRPLGRWPCSWTCSV